MGIYFAKENKKMMKKILFGFILAMMINVSDAQVAKLQWAFSSKKIGTNKYEIHLTATPPAGWHTYSQTTPDGGPLPTTIKFNNNALVTLVGKTKEVGKIKTVFDGTFKVNVKFFEGKADFVQVVTTKGPIKTNVSGKIEAMMCNDHVCMPAAAQEFNISLN